MESIIEKLGKVSVTVEKDYHSSEKEYNKLTIVEEQGTFKTYISRKPVPVEIALTNREYWIPFSGVLESITFDYLKFKQEYGSGERLEDNSIKTRHIENGAIVSNKIFDGSIVNSKIADDTIEIEKFSTNVRNIIKAATDLKAIMPTQIRTDYSENNVSLTLLHGQSRLFGDVISAATQEKAGVMSAEDKKKLDGIRDTVVFTGATVDEETEMLVLNRVDEETLVLDEVSGTLPGGITKVSQLENDKGYLTGEVAEESIILNND